ncbi:MAG: hypothetical protein SFX74_07090 [Fimbriimonadaceae bacterium]|nr:hypothetical protein [Fimbriimonadaceae bacterium]
MIRARMLAIAASGLATALAAVTTASDHGNLDKARPLRVEDAYSIAFNSREFQSGLEFRGGRSARSTIAFRNELQFGYARNADVSIGWVSNLVDSRGRATAGQLDLSGFWTFRQESVRGPALGLRVDLDVPLTTAEGSSSLGGRVRAIASRHVGRYDQLHLNLDAIREAGTRRSGSGSNPDRWAATVGFSTPVGLPYRFETTAIAEVGIERAWRGGPTLGLVGAGFRRQFAPRAVWDLGAQWVPGSRQTWRLVTGVSLSF